MIPTRRSTGEAVQILVSHALGDAGSPYLVGLVSAIVLHQFHQNYCNVREQIVNNIHLHVRQVFLSSGLTCFRFCLIDIGPHSCQRGRDDE